MQFDHDVHLVAHGAADLLERLQRGFQVRQRDEPASGFFGRAIKGPDLHAGDAILQQGQRQIVRVVQKAVQIVIDAVRTKPVIRGGLPGRLLDVIGPGAGVVGADLVAGEAAQKLRDRLAGGLAEQVPQRDVERRIAAHLGPGRTEAHIARQLRRQPAYRQWIAPDHPRGHIVVQMRFDRRRAEKGLPQPGQTLVGMHQDPDQVGTFGNSDRFQPGDLHDRPACSKARTLSSKCVAIAVVAVCGSEAAMARAMVSCVAIIVSRAPGVVRLFQPTGQVALVIC